MGTWVIIVQHGEKERLPGDPGLTPAGRVQAALSAAHLAGRAGSVASVYASPLRRARETAIPIASALGVDLHTDDRLREQMNWEDPDVQSLEDFLADDHVRARRADLIDDGVLCCGLTTLRRQGRGWTVVGIAETTHLQPLE